MSNLSYCRFENTLLDLRDCFEHLDDKIEEEAAAIAAARETGDEDEDGYPEEDEDTVSRSEAAARERLIALCIEIANGWGG